MTDTSTPFNQTSWWASVPLQTLKPANSQISFDPLAVLAILHNTRATGSVTKLYHACIVDGKVLYRWPNTIMIGGALLPFKLLIDHLVSPLHSSHPIIDLYKADRYLLDVRTELDVPSHNFPVAHSHIWLLDLLSFKTVSENPSHDIMIINLDTIHGTRKQPITGQRLEASHVDLRWKQVALWLIMLCTTAFLVIALAASLFWLDFWAVALFSAYLLHAIMSIMVSFRSIVTITDRNKTSTKHKEDSNIHFLLHQRQTGGRVIIKARQDALYSWQLMSYSFNNTNSILNHIVHWGWMTSGALSAAASVVCMVNMRGETQLMYAMALGVSSILEIVATQIVRAIHRDAIHYGRHQAIVGNKTWTAAIIRAALEVEDRLSLENVDWMKHGQLPGDMTIFKNLVEILPKIRKKESGFTKEGGIRENLEHGLMDWEKGPEPYKLPNRLTREIMSALKERQRATDNRATGPKQQ